MRLRLEGYLVPSADQNSSRYRTRSGYTVAVDQYAGSSWCPEVVFVDKSVFARGEENAEVETEDAKRRAPILHVISRL